MLRHSKPSVFSPQTIGERGHGALLLQFLLFELLEAYQAATAEQWDLFLTSHARFFPYDWSCPIGYLNKIWEHSSFLQQSFSHRRGAVKSFEKTLKKHLDLLSKKKAPAKEVFESTLQELYFCLEPLIECCKEDENLIFFLLKHRERIDLLTERGHLRKFMLKIHPCGLETLGEKMCDQYHQRGFFSQISEFKLLLTDLLHA
jgi:hypothetical protein